VVPIINDKEIEDPESLEMALFNVTGGGALGFDPTATLTIISDDSQVSFLTETYNVK
jgi:hypothetical protein